MKLMAQGYARHGEVFTVPVLHKKITFLLGPKVSGHFFKANDEEMSQKEVRASRGRLSAPHALLCSLYATFCTAGRASSNASCPAPFTGH